MTEYNTPDWIPDELRNSHQEEIITKQDAVMMAEQRIQTTVKPFIDKVNATILAKYEPGGGVAIYYSKGMTDGMKRYIIDVYREGGWTISTYANRMILR